MLSLGKASGESLKLSLPSIDWGIEVTSPEFQLIDEAVLPLKSSAKTFASSDSSGLLISIHLEKAETDGGPEACRDFYWSRAKNSPFEKSNLQFSEKRDYATVEYLVKEFQGQEVNQKNLNAYFSNNGYWIDVHVSKMNYKSADKTLFNKAIKSIRIFGKGAASPNTQRNFLLPNGKMLILDIPEDWNHTFKQPDDGLPPTIQFDADNNTEFAVLVTPIWSPEGDKKFNSPEKIKELMQERLDRMLSSAVEDALEMIKVTGMQGEGLYFSITDKNPKPDEYLIATPAGMAVDDLLLSVTVLGQKKDCESIKATIRMLETAKTK